MATTIEWTRSDDGSAGETWNPVTGCDRVSPGCDHCYALTLAKRLKAMGNPKYQRDGDSRTSGPGFRASLHPDVLGLPLLWRRPRRIFVNSMSDLFHDDIPDEYIAQVFAVMAQARHHTFQLLTKRHGRMRSLLDADGLRLLEATTDEDTAEVLTNAPWPLPNVWVGVSVEDQKWADIRIPALLDTPAAVRFLSCEPLLGSVDIDRYLWLIGASTAGPWRDYAGRRRLLGGGSSGVGGMMITSIPARDLSWIIVGAESGAGARPMDEAWAQSIVDQCRAASVPVFVKQLSAGRRANHDIDTFPPGLRVREYPQAVTA